MEKYGSNQGSSAFTGLFETLYSEEKALIDSVGWDPAIFMTQTSSNVVLPLTRTGVCCGCASCRGKECVSNV